MKKVRVAELKAQLSKHLRSVRAGKSIVVLDRDTPIARIVPYAPEAADGDDVVVRRAKKRPGDVELPPPLARGLLAKLDVVALLVEERRRDR